MRITEVRIFKKDDHDKKLLAFATITVDGCFVVRDIKIIEGAKGLFVAMPSRRLKESCPKCRNKNPVRSSFCNQCGASISKSCAPQDGALDEKALRQQEHKDIAHPITPECREYVQKQVLEAYQQQKDHLKSCDSDGKLNS